ncbi:SF3a splicing factor complex subunit [Myotisia sp. PD_48]|nr:SF3a splicing factor complex subunit [Myotisia sp. PD_48]
MAPSAVDGPVAATPDLPEEVSKPPEGVILPPRDIKVIVEKTAGFVARNGPVFEDRVREKERNNPKFCFLNPTDAYAAFYTWRLGEIKAGRGTDVSAGRVGEPAAAAETEIAKGPEAPPEFQFAARMPNINALDLEVVKLTALFVAKRGKSFMTALSQRETRNFQFDFLRPQHSLYQFFTRLVDQYKQLLQIDAADSAKAKERLTELDKNIKNKYHVLDRAKQRAEWVKYQEQQQQKKEEAEEEEKLAYAQVDWHDFVVVETVLFTEADDQVELPPPTSLNDLQTASLEQKAMMSLQPHDRRIEEAMPTDEDTYYNAEPPTSETPQYGTASLPIILQQHPEFSQQPSPIPSQAVTSTDASLSPSIGADHPVPSPSPTPHQPPAMRIRSDYVPRAQAKRLNTTSQPTTLCPNCRQQIPIAEIENHMRIELLDPRWKEQRAKAEARFATTNLSTVDVANNLKRLASQRSDVFDAVPAGNGDNPEDLHAQDASRRKRVAGIGPGGVPLHMPAENPVSPPVPVPAPAHPVMQVYDPNSQAPGVGPGPPPDPPRMHRPVPYPAQPAPPPIDIKEQIRKIHEKMRQ